MLTTRPTIRRSCLPSRLLAWLAVVFSGLAASAPAQEVGPANGSLLLAGGAIEDESIYQRFLDLAGGADVPIVVIPTALGAASYRPHWRGLLPLKRLGASQLTVLHTTDPKEADTEAFVQPLQEARAVWFTGGRQWRLVDSYLGTRVQEELEALLGRGGVIGGSSAGATIQGSYLARGDTKTNTIMMGDHEEGLGFLRDVAVDQHVIRRNRHFDLIEIIEARPELLGIGIDENTAIVVRRDAFEVIGQGYVAIYDAQRMIDSGGKFYFLAPGDRFDLTTRTATRPRTVYEPLQRVVEKPWSKN